jgi:hypothetical protein
MGRKNMVIDPEGAGTNDDCAGEGQQQIYPDPTQNFLILASSSFTSVRS